MPYLIRIPLGPNGLVVKARETWPRATKIYCHRAAAWPAETRDRRAAAGPLGGPSRSRHRPRAEPGAGEPLAVRADPGPRQGDDLLADGSDGQAGPAPGQPANREGPRRAAGDHRGFCGEVRIRLPTPAGHHDKKAVGRRRLRRRPRRPDRGRGRAEDRRRSRVIAPRRPTDLCVGRAGCPTSGGDRRGGRLQQDLQPGSSAPAPPSPRPGRSAGPIPAGAGDVLREPGYGAGMDLPLARGLSRRAADGPSHLRAGADLRRRDDQPNNRARQRRPPRRSVAGRGSRALPYPTRAGFPSPCGRPSPIAERAQTRRSRAHMWDCSGWPAAALSKVHSRSPSTVPYSRCPAE